jgi:hypothetical protein
MLLLTAILADGINLGISKMAEACAGTTARKLDWLASLHIRDETYAKALAELVNHLLRGGRSSNCVLLASFGVMPAAHIVSQTDCRMRSP